MGEVEIVKAELESGIAPLLQKARTLVVSSQADYDIAMQIGKECANRIRFVEEGRLNAIKVEQYKVYKMTMDLIGEIVKPLKEVMATLKNKALTWQQEENRKREAEARETRRKEEDARLALAAEFEAAGEKEAAESAISEPIRIEPVKVVQAAGTSVAQNWTWQITDIILIPRAYMVPNESALTQLAKHEKEKANLPGVLFYDKGSVRFGR